MNNKDTIMELYEVINRFCYKTEGYFFSYSERRDGVRVNIFDATRFIECVYLYEALSHAEFIEWCEAYIKKAKEAENE